MNITSVTWLEFYLMTLNMTYSSLKNVMDQAQKIDGIFSHAFIFGNMFPESHCFVAMPVTSCVKDTCSNISLSN